MMIKYWNIEGKRGEMVDSQHQIEALGENVTREYLHYGRIIVYRIVGGGRKTSDIWADHMIDDLQNWDRDQPYLSLQDLSESGISVYGKKRTEDIFINIPSDLKVYIALVLGENIFAKFIKVLSQNLSRVYRGRQVEFQFFATRQSALRWLEKFLDD